MNDAEIEGMSAVAVANEAAVEIKVALKWDGRGTAVRSFDPEVMAKVGEIVDRAVSAAGGDAKALWAVSKALAKLVPVGARRLRMLRRAYRQSLVVDEAATSLVGLMAGDIAADFVNAGQRVERLLQQCGSAFESDVLAALAARLQVSSRKLRQFHDAYLVSRLGGSRLAHLVPSTVPYPVLAQFAPLLRADLMPWRIQVLIVKAAEEVARRRLTGKQVDSVVRDLLAQGPDKDEAPLRVLPAWHFPSAPARRTDAVQPAA